MKAALLIGGAIIFYIFVLSLWAPTFSEGLVFTSSLLLLFQGAFFTTAMYYSWRHPKALLSVTPPKLLFGRPKRKFTLIIPARFEEAVIKDTLLSFSQINYPPDNFEVLVVTRSDDVPTKTKVIEAMRVIPTNNVHLLTSDEPPINKSKSLNFALMDAKYNYIGVFDAEDQPHPDLLLTIDTFLDYNPDTDVVQSGIQLVNVPTSWFSPLACLEYYYWFKSVLPLFASLGATPLGGNTVFFRKEALQKVGGWDETVLTEDAEIGVRLASLGFKTRMICDERLSTLEETPPTRDAFLRQRTRWIQGYLQTIAKGHWASFPRLSQQILSLSLLAQPVVHEFLALSFVLNPIIALFASVPLWLALFSFLPAYFLLLQWLGIVFGLSDLRKIYHLSFSWTTYPKALLSYFPYQLLVSLAFLRAVKRLIFCEFSWEKTAHWNLHRAIS